MKSYAVSCMIFNLMDKYLFSNANSLPDIVGIWVRGWNKAEKALSIPVAMNKQKEKEIHRWAPHIEDIFISLRAG